MFFENHVRRFGKVSVGISAFCVLFTLFFHCGGVLGGLVLLVHGPALLVGLLLPLSVRGLKGLFQGSGNERPRLSWNARAWAAAALVVLVASFPLMGWLAHGGRCFN